MRYHPFAHIGLKLMALVLALLLWVMVATQRSPVERGLRIPLELQNLPTNLELVDSPQESVDVRLRGAADVLARLAPGDVVATIDLSSAQPGRRLFHLSPDRVRAPFAVEVTQITPSTIGFRFEPSATRIVSVHPTLEGEPAPGYIVGEVTAEPGTVEVVGPESALRQVTEAITEPVWVGGATAAVRASVPLGVPETGVRLKNPRTANVRVQIVDAPVERQLTVPVRLRNLAEGLSAQIDPPAVRVRVHGTKATIGRLGETSLAAYVDVDGIVEGEYGLPVRVDPVPGVGLDRPEPAVVRIHIK